MQKEYDNLQHISEKSVCEFTRDFLQVRDELKDRPSIQRQLIKQGLLEPIRTKLEIREYADRQDMIVQAKLVEINLLNSKASRVHTNLTKGMVSRPKANNFLLGIHKENKSNE